MVGKVRFLVYMEELLVGLLVGSVLNMDLSGAVKKKWVTSGFGLKVIIGWSLCVSGPCTFQISYGTRPLVA